MVMGPLAGQILADLGADLVKVEPVGGDVARTAQPNRDGMGALFANNNRNKRAIALDLKSTAGRRVLERLIARTDVLLHNMRMDAVERLGAGFAAASALNPRLIYCSAIGFGRGGRYRDRPAYDDIIQAAGGMAGLNQAVGEAPRFVPTILADKVGALHAVYGVLAALVARERGGATPIEVEVPMFEALVSFLMNEHLAGATFDADGAVGYPRVLSPDRRPHRTGDGWLAVLPYTVEQWRRFLQEIGRDDVIALPWFSQPSGCSANIDFLYGVVSKALPERTTADWLERLTRLDIPCSQVNRLQDLLEDPHLGDVDHFGVPADYAGHIRRMLPQPVRFGGFGAETDRPPPPLGSHTRAVLEECGFGPDEIQHMLESGAALQHVPAPPAAPSGDPLERDPNRAAG